MTDTRGTGILNRVFYSWEPFKGSISGRRQGVLISMENGKSVAYAIFNLEDRGRFFIGAGEVVYQGMIIGEHTRENDLEVNPLKGKKLTNVRASGTDEAVRLTTPTRFSLEPRSRSSTQVSRENLSESLSRVETLGAFDDPVHRR